MTNSSFDPVKIGVVGLGFFGKLHAQTITGLAETELVALCARRQESLDEAKHLGLDAPGWMDLRKAVSESDADAWVVAATTSQHIPITKLLLEAGKSVLLEKPLSQSLDEAESIRSLVDESRGHLMLGHILLFGTEFRQLLEEIIPTVIDPNPCAHLRMPRDMIFHGWSMRLFQAWQHSATMSS